MGNAALKSDEHCSYADYAKWTDDKRYELIDGVAYAMTSPTWRRQELVGEVFRQSVPDVIVDCVGLFPVQEDA